MPKKPKDPQDPTNPDRKYPKAEDLSLPNFGFDILHDEESGETKLSEWRPLQRPHLMDGFMQAAIMSMLQIHPTQRAAVMAKYCYHCGDDLDELEQGLCHCQDGKK